jgi:flavin-dependent dehydrogenase
MKYDYLIVGCGMFGSVFARQATDAGKKALVIDKRPHIAGNCYTEKVKGIEVHKYGNISIGSQILIILLIGQKLITKTRCILFP